MTMQGSRYTNVSKDRNANTNVRGSAKGQTSNPADPRLVGDKGKRKGR